MQMRLSRPVLASGARPTSGVPRAAVRAAAGALLLGVLVSACGGGGASPTPSVYTPTPRTTGASSPVVTRTPSVGSGTSAPASARASTAKPSTAKAAPTPTRAISSAPASSPAPSPSLKATKTITASPRPRQTVTTTQYPTAAPQTGGGGTAGLQDGLLLTAGGGALLAGLGSLAYRRRLRRSLRSAQRGSAGQHPGPARPSDREPADR